MISYRNDRFSTRSVVNRGCDSSGAQHGLKPAQDTKKLTYTNIRDAYVAEARDKELRFDMRKDGSEWVCRD